MEPVPKKPKPRDIKRSYRWSEDDLALIEELATDLGMSHTQVLRHALRELRDQRRRRRLRNNLQDDP